MNTKSSVFTSGEATSANTADLNQNALECWARYTACLFIIWTHYCIEKQNCSVLYIRVIILVVPIFITVLFVILRQVVLQPGDNATVLKDVM